MKSVKKLVLVGLVLLASVMVLLPLVGCKREVDPEVKEPPYLTFKADSEQTLTMKIQEEYTLHESLQYSVGGGEWKQLQAETALSFGGAAGDLRMRGKSAGGTGIYKNGEALFTYISFGNSEVKVACTGDIRTLVNYESYSTADTSVAVFAGLFYECTSLSSAPALPAETLAEGCYWGMFYGCTSLSSAPALPAKTLAVGCYTGMFYGCTSLSSAPALPAESLAPYCYSGMFSGCTSLSSAPALPAESLAPYCYGEMFEGCTKLSSVTMLATDISASSCLLRWLDSVSETGTFTKAAAMDENAFTRGSSGIPVGWTVQDYVPQQ